MGGNEPSTGVGFILVMVLCYWRILKMLGGLSHRPKMWGFSPRLIFSLLAGLLLFSAAILTFHSQTKAPALSFASAAGAKLRPHILFVTSDAVKQITCPLTVTDARPLRVFKSCFNRPWSLKMHSRIRRKHLVQSSRFTLVNTHRRPVSFFPPDALKGHDCYEHLPGILRSQGYRTVQIAFPYYLDANILNVSGGFDEIRTTGSHNKYLDAISKVLPNEEARFTYETINRIVDRCRHIFFIAKMINPYSLVTGVAEPLEDRDRLELVKEEIRTTRQPLFVHLHLMITHGPKYKLTEQTYSAGRAIKSQARWTDDFYDDSIRETDRNVGDLIDYLTDLELLDNTVLIIASDHGRKWNPLERLPFIIRFPHGQYAGRIQANVQNLDIAPTVLDYIGLDQPGWMRGTSLIAGKLEQRLIFGMSRVFPEELNLITRGDNGAKAPSPSGELYVNTLIVCRRWFELNLYYMSWESGTIRGSSTACPPGGKSRASGHSTRL